MHVRDVRDVRDVRANVLPLLHLFFLIFVFVGQLHLYFLVYLVSLALDSMVLVCCYALYCLVLRMEKHTSQLLSHSSSAHCLWT